VSVFSSLSNRIFFATSLLAVISIGVAIYRVNDAVKLRMIDKIVEALGGDVKGKTIAILGLAFKPETDDMRESPAIDIVHKMVACGATVKAFDPVAMEEAARCLNGIEYARDEYDAIDGADAMVIITEWNQFRALDMEKVKRLLRSPKIADLRNIYEPADMRALGFEYVGVGR